MLDGVGGKRHTLAALLLGKKSGTHQARWAPGPVGTGAENLALTGNRSPDCPAHSEWLHRLSYPGPRYQLRNTSDNIFLSWLTSYVEEISGRFINVYLGVRDELLIIFFN